MGRARAYAVHDAESILQSEAVGSQAGRSVRDPQAGLCLYQWPDALPPTRKLGTVGAESVTHVGRMTPHSFLRTSTNNAPV